MVDQGKTVSGYLLGLSAALIACALMASTHDHWIEDWSLTATLLAVTCAIQIVFATRGRWWQRILLSVTVTAVIFLSTFVVDALLREWEARTPSMNLVGQVVSWLVSWAGYHASFDDSCIKVAHPEGIVSILPSVDKIGIRWVAVFLWSWTGLLAANRVRDFFRKVTFAVFIGAVLMVIKFAVVMMLYLESSQILSLNGGAPWLGMMVGYWSHAGMLVLIGLAVGAMAGSCQCVSSPFQNAERETEWKQATLVYSIVALMAFSITLGHYCKPPGSSKLGRVLFDDTLGGQWEPTARLLDMDWFGDYSTYSFSTPVEWLSAYYSVDVNAGRAYTAELLDEYDVLVIKTPEHAIPLEQQAAIEAWVRRGGGLLLVGDHTNLLGMGAKLNPLASKAGIKFNYDAIGPRARGGFNNYSPTWVTPHYVAEGINNLLFMTSCSLSIEADVESVLTVSDCSRDPHDYANSSYFGNRRSYPETEYGPAVLCAINDLESGKVAAFTDSTVWSSFAFHKFGRSRLFLNLINRLNQRPSALQWPLFLMTLSLLVVLGVGFWKLWSQQFIVMLALSLVGFGLAQVVATRLNAKLHAPPLPHQKVPTAVFLWEGGQCAFPETLGDAGDLPASDMFDTFFVATQRVGIVPRVIRKTSKVFDNPSDCIVMIRPIWVPEDSFLEQLSDYVSAGGSLVLLEDVENGSIGSVGPILKALGINYELAQDSEGNRFVRLNDSQIGMADPGNINVGLQKLGDGKIVYIPTATRFSREGMGHCFTIPPEKSKVVYETIDTVFRDVIGVGRADVNRRTYKILERR